MLHYAMSFAPRLSAYIDAQRARLGIASFDLLAVHSRFVCLLASFCLLFSICLIFCDFKYRHGDKAHGSAINRAEMTPLVRRSSPFFVVVFSFCSIQILLPQPFAHVYGLARAVALRCDFDGLRSTKANMLFVARDPNRFHRHLPRDQVVTPFLSSPSHSLKILFSNTEIPNCWRLSRRRTSSIRFAPSFTGNLSPECVCVFDRCARCRIRFWDTTQPREPNGWSTHDLMQGRSVFVAPLIGADDDDDVCSFFLRRQIESNARSARRVDVSLLVERRNNESHRVVGS